MGRGIRPASAVPNISRRQVPNTDHLPVLHRGRHQDQNTFRRPGPCKGHHLGLYRVHRQDLYTGRRPGPNRTLHRVRCNTHHQARNSLGTVRSQG